MKKAVIRLRMAVILAAVMLLISSCATLSGKGVSRIKCYEVESERLPDCFDGYEIAFVSDLHYPSLFSTKRLQELVATLNEISPSMLLLGGDYVTSNDSIDKLFLSISSVKTADGIYAVMGNHERENLHLIAQSMKERGIVWLADDTVMVEHGEEAFCLVGVADSFNYDSACVQYAGCVADSLFTVLLCHTPDYAERTSTTADLVLSGHTHGGQVSLFGVYTPVRNTVYGNRFLRGMNNTTSGATIITTNGVGTSRRKIRFCVPSEVVVVTLRSKKAE